MKNVEKNEHPNYSQFDNLDTDALRAFLAADVDAPEAERLDIDAVMYIVGLLSEREKSEHKYPEADVEAAKAEFFEQYYPLAEEGHSLYDFDEDENARIKGNKHIVWRHWLRYGINTAAALLIFLVVGTATAVAFGYNPWQLIASWTDEIFWFEQETASPTAELQQTLLDNGIDLPLVPKWLPQGYEQEDHYVRESTTRTEIYYLYRRTVEDDKESLGVSIKYHALDGKFTSNYEKNSVEVITYTVNDIDHYITYNNNCRTIVWQNANAECLIKGQFNVEEAKQMIDSIYEE